MATLKAAKIPPLIYGTAWKKEKTRTLVKQALLVGFRAIDTAAQPKHYQEDLVGEGIRDAMAEAELERSELYIQTKYTSPHGQDPSRMPYDPSQSIADQVAASVASSLRNLRPSDTAGPSDSSYLDCLVLHSPFPSMAQTKEAWRAMERHYPQQARTLGISNIYQVDVLKALYHFAHVKPSVVQNRFYAQTGWDAEIRAFCTEKGMVYQSFWTLTGNPELLRSEPVRNLAGQVGVSAPVALYGIVLGLGNTAVLDGTTNVGRMKEDLGGVERVREWAHSSGKHWGDILNAFQTLLRR